MPHYPRNNVRRGNVTACARCKQRKQRCDQNLPACSNCERAGASCVFTDSAGHATSRRYITDLEDKVAALESQLMDASTTVTTQDTLEPQESANWSTCSNSSPHAPMKHPWPRDFEIPSYWECRVLIDAYFEHSNFFSPFLDQSKFAQRVQNLYGKSIAMASTDPKAMFILCSVLAVAVKLLHSGDPTYPGTSAERFSTVAFSAYEDDAETLRTGDLEELECLLLMVQYTMFASDLTTCLRYMHSATSLAVVLNLHTCPIEKQDNSTIGERRLQDDSHERSPRSHWLFWTTYNFERNICSALQMPMAIPDQAIKSPLPQNYNNDHTQALAIHIVRYRQLESAIQTYRDQSIQAQDGWRDFAALRSQLLARLLAWKEQCPPFLQPRKQVSFGIIEGLFEVAAVRLYSAPSQLANLSMHETSALLEHAAHGITIYRKSFKEGSLRFYWRTINTLFQCGSALIHCVKVSATNPDIVIDMGEASRLATICSAVLWGMAERYPAGSRLRDTFDDLAENTFHMKPRKLVTMDSAGSIGIGQFPGSQVPGPYVPGALYDLDNFDEILCCI